MNALKFQQDMLAEKLKGGADRNTAWCKMDDKHTLFCLRTHVIMCLPTSSTLLDTRKLYLADGMKKLAWDAMKMRDEQNLLTDTHRVMITPKGKAHVFTVGKREAWIDPKLLSYFDLSHAKLYQETEKGPILVVEKFGAEEFAGLIMPLKQEQPEQQLEKTK